MTPVVARSGSNENCNVISLDCPTSSESQSILDCAAALEESRLNFTSDCKDAETPFIDTSKQTSHTICSNQKIASSLSSNVIESGTGIDCSSISDSVVSDSHESKQTGSSAYGVFNDHGAYRIDSSVSSLVSKGKSRDQDDHINGFLRMSSFDQTEQATFMLDEELELDQTTEKHDFSSLGRYMYIRILKNMQCLVFFYIFLVFQICMIYIINP